MIGVWVKQVYRSLNLGSIDENKNGGIGYFLKQPEYADLDLVRSMLTDKRLKALREIYSTNNN